MKTCKTCKVSKGVDAYYSTARAECKECMLKARNQKKEEYLANADNIVKLCNICKESKNGTNFSYDSFVCKTCKAKKQNRVANRPSADMPDKTCSKCDVQKQATAFRFRTNVCKECEKKDMYQWRLNNPEKFKDHLKKYRSSDLYKTKRNMNRREEYQCNLQERVKTLCRNRIRSAINATRLGQAVKSAKSEVLLGCSIAVVMEWLEFNFEDGMTWDNIGTYWHIDHITPCASFDLSKEEEQMACFHWTNMAPLEGKENILKAAKIDKRLIKYYEYRVQEFKKSNPNILDANLQRHDQIAGTP
jgi:hypothetical protein